MLHTVIYGERKSLLLQPSHLLTSDECNTALTALFVMGGGGLVFEPLQIIHKKCKNCAPNLRRSLQDSKYHKLQSQALQTDSSQYIMVLLGFPLVLEF